MPAARAFEPELVLVSAGFDAHRDDPLAKCMLEAGSFAADGAPRAWRSGAELGVPVGAVLEGGYDLDALAASVAATLEAFASARRRRVGRRRRSHPARGESARELVAGRGLIRSATSVR